MAEKKEVIHAVVVADLAPAESTLTSKLADLTAARDAGLINVDEFADAKRALLANLAGGSGGAAEASSAAIGGGSSALSVVQELISHQWSGGKPGGGGESYESNPWSFRGDKTFVTLRDGCNGTWSCRADGGAPGGVVLRMEWAAGQHGNWAEFAAQGPGSEPRLRATGASYGFMQSWNIKKGSASGGVGVVTQQPGGGGDANDFPGKIKAEDLAGCWTCCCIPGGVALFAKEAQGPDMLIHKGCVLLFCVLPLPFEEPRVRSGRSNGFVKADGSDPGNVDHYVGSRWVCNGISCSLKLC